MKRKVLKNMEWGILACSIILLTIGMVALFSATQNSEYTEFKRQFQWIVVSIPIVIVCVMVDYNNITKISPYLYGIILIFLVGVLFTPEVNGASSWFVVGESTFQPSEIAKVFLILFLAFIMGILQRKGKNEINKLWKIGICLLIVAVPTLLIMMQPDYGTAFAFIISAALMLFISGIKIRYVIVTILLLIIIVPLAYVYVLPEHAKARIDVFLNPEQDPRGAGYNIIQSKLAIGAGQLTGMGMFKGNQTQLGFLYPKTTDFIFAVIGEEFGFVISAIIIIIYVILITKAIYIAKTAKDDTGSYIAMGIAGVLFFHMVENIGMTMGLLPITGIPLPFVSYGGNNMLTNFICIGLLLNISGRRQKAIFAE